jgi:alpha-glucosidase
MLGSKYLVAPIMGPEDSRSVRLPQGTWRADDGTLYEGGKCYTIEVPIERLLWFTQE